MNFLHKNNNQIRNIWRLTKPNKCGNMYIMIKTIPTKELQTRRIKRAEEACKRATTDWSKNYWFNVFKKLCEKYNQMEYFRKTIH